MDIAAYKNVILPRIEQEYYRVRAKPVTLLEVADLFGFDYYDFCMWLRKDGLRNGFKLHVRTAKEAKLLKQDNSQYLLDYYLVTGYSYDIIAIIFNYDGGANVGRAIKKSPAYISRIKGVAPHKKTCRPIMVERVIPVCRAVSNLTLSTHRLNRLVYRGVESRIPIQRSWQMDIEKEATFYFFEPILEIVTLYCKSHNYNLAKFVNMAIIQEKIPGSSDKWLARPSTCVR